MVDKPSQELGGLLRHLSYMGQDIQSGRARWTRGGGVMVAGLRRGLLGIGGVDLGSLFLKSARRFLKSVFKACGKLFIISPTES